MKMDARSLQKVTAVVLLAAKLSLTMTAKAADWPQWRGPDGNGSSPETGLASTCDPAKAEWIAPLPGDSHATPAIVGGRIFLTSTDPASKGLLAMCLSATDGKVLWQKRLGDEIKAPKNNGATPSPVTDGKNVGFLFGSGDLAVLDMAGNLRWSENLVKKHGNLCTKFGYSSSPLLWNGTLYVQILRRDKPYSATAAPPSEPLEPLLLAFDFLTGRELWKQVRKSAAVDESRESYTTPAPLSAAGKNELLILGGDCLTGHEPATGAELWRLEYNPGRDTMWRVIPSPATVGGLIVAAVPRGGPLMALNSGGKGRIDPAALAWSYDERTTDSGTPLVYQNRIYILQSDKNDPWSRGSKSSPGIFLLAVDPAIGKETGRCRIAPGGAWRASPTGADGKIYLLSEAGEVVVVAAEPTPRILSRTDFADGPACATIAVANHRIFIRTASKLTCIGPG